MALNITYTIECHCGSDARSTTMYLDLNPGEPIVVDAEMAIGQTDFECPDVSPPQPSPGPCGPPPQSLPNCPIWTSALYGCVTGTGDIYTEVATTGADCAGHDGGESGDGDG